MRATIKEGSGERATLDVEPVEIKVRRRAHGSNVPTEVIGRKRGGFECFGLMTGDEYLEAVAPGFRWPR